MELHLSQICNIIGKQESKTLSGEKIENHNSHNMNVHTYVHSYVNQIEHVQ